MPQWRRSRGGLEKTSQPPSSKPFLHSRLTLTHWHGRRRWRVFFDNRRRWRSSLLGFFADFFDFASGHVLVFFEFFFHDFFDIDTCRKFISSIITYSFKPFQRSCQQKSKCSSRSICCHKYFRRSFFTANYNQQPNQRKVHRASHHGTRRHRKELPEGSGGHCWSKFAFFVNKNQKLIVVFLLLVNRVIWSISWKSCLLFRRPNWPVISFVNCLATSKMSSTLVNLFLVTLSPVNSIQLQLPRHSFGNLMKMTVDLMSTLITVLFSFQCKWTKIFV